MDGNSLALSVIVPTLGSSPHLRGLLERLLRQKTNFAFEVLVVANLPQQPLRELVQSLHNQIEQVRSTARTFAYHETGRIGVNLARNKGIEHAVGEIMLFLDDDTLLSDDAFLQNHVDAHLAHPEAIGIGGPYRLVESGNLWSKSYHRLGEQRIQNNLRDDGKAERLNGGNMSLKRAGIKRHRVVFDEEVYFGASESGLCLKLILRNETLLYIDALAIGHIPELIPWSFIRKAFLQGAGTQWREQTLGTTSHTSLSEWRRPPPRGRFDNLYRLFFLYGKDRKCAAGAKALPDPADRVFRFSAGFVFFCCKLLAPIRHLRHANRSLYLTVRSAWLNERAVG